MNISFLTEKLPHSQICGTNFRPKKTTHYSPSVKRTGDIFLGKNTRFFGPVMPFLVRPCKRQRLYMDDIYFFAKNGRQRHFDFSEKTGRILVFRKLLDERFLAKIAIIFIIS